MMKNAALRVLVQLGARRKPVSEWNSERKRERMGARRLRSAAHAYQPRRRHVRAPAADTPCRRC